MPGNDTIAAISTPFGEGAIAVLRISGPAAIEILQRISALENPPSRTALLTTIEDGGKVLDHVLATVFRAPASYTGEDLVEISCHGGILLTRRVLDLLLRNGARTAEPGEFTQRAFVNGKMDLTQAEAVMDLIQAHTDLALRAANEQLSGALGREVTRLRDALLDIRAHVEAYIDFPEEDIDPETGDVLIGKLVEIHTSLESLLSTADQGRILREGVRTAIVGSPNAGKSSLLNRLVGFDRAIVSELPGTTRDTVEEFINIHGIPLRLIDTAGIRDSSDRIEKEGIARSHREIELADLVLHIVDVSEPARKLIRYPREILVLNKSDLPAAGGWPGGIAVSCKSGEGIAELAAEIRRVVTEGAATWNESVVAINARHQACLVKASTAVSAAMEALAAGRSAEFAAADLHAAMEALGEVAGKLDTEDILDKIFSTFCLGK